MRLNNYKEYFKSKKILFENFLSLSFYQAANYLMPIFAYPYIIRVIGNENFGLLMFALAFVQYLMMFIDFGFDYTATREVSIHRNNSAKIKEIFKSIFIIKFFLLLISILILIVCIFTIPKISNNYLVFIFTFIMAIGQLLFPIWYYQGIEKMKYMAIINLIFKTTGIILIFVFIKNKEQTNLVPLIISLSYLVSGITAFIVAVIKIKPDRSIPDFKTIQSYFKQSLDVFITNVGTSLYTTATPLILGFIANNIAVSYFTLAEKTVRGIRYLVSPITQAIFPAFSKKFSEQDKKDSISNLKKFTILLFPLTLVMALCVIVFAPLLSKILTGNYIYEVIRNLRIASSIIVIGTLNNVLGIIGMINLKMEKYLKKYIIIGGLCNIILGITLSYQFKDLGAVLSVVTSETLIFILIYLHLKRSEK